MKIKTFTIISLLFVLLACGSQRNENQQSDTVEQTDTKMSIDFNADSAYQNIERQVAFGPRVPNTAAHRNCRDWLADELKRYGAEVTLQDMKLTAFDGTVLEATNIIGSYNPDAQNRLLLLAHWDCRPWADADPDPANHKKPVDGANDGASGVGVLLEIARLLHANPTDKGIDILFVDAEDWGTEGDDLSWAMGARYFAANPHRAGYRPQQAILLDMVGGKDAVFYREYFSMSSAPWLVDKVWNTAANSGYGERFNNEVGGAVTDDHVELIKAGIPAIDIIEHHPYNGFNPTWHTIDDTMEGISRETLKAVGQTVANYIYDIH